MSEGREKFLLPDLVFEWDEEKDRINFQKHGVHFRTAVKVFKDPWILFREDREHGREERYNIIGKAAKVLFIVVTVRNENTIRIISARIADRKEREIYENGCINNE